MSITVATRSDRFVCGARLLCGLQGKPIHQRLLLQALLQPDGHGVTRFLPDRLAYVGLHRELVRSVAHLLPGAGSGAVPDRTPKAVLDRTPRLASRGWYRYR
jgi:hypothetical protein